MVFGVDNLTIRQYIRTNPAFSKKVVQIITKEMVSRPSSRKEGVSTV